MLLPPALVLGCPSSMSERETFVRSTLQGAKKAAEERLHLHVRSVLMGSANSIQWVAKKKVRGEHLVGYSHFGRWQIGFERSHGKNMGYVLFPCYSKDPRSPHPYYKDASLDDLKGMVRQFNMDIAERMSITDDVAIKGLLRKNGTLKPLEWKRNILDGSMSAETSCGPVRVSHTGSGDVFSYRLPWMLDERSEVVGTPDVGASSPELMQAAEEACLTIAQAYCNQQEPQPEMIYA